MTRQTKLSDERRKELREMEVKRKQFSEDLAKKKARTSQWYSIDGKLHTTYDKALKVINKFQKEHPHLKVRITDVYNGTNYVYRADYFYEAKNPAG